MKISNLTETMATPTSMPTPGQPGAKFGRSDEMLESGVGTSVAGGMAPSAKSMGKMQRRGQGSMFQGIKTSDKFANSRKAGIKEDAVNEDELSEEQLQAKQKREEIFNRAKDKELGNKPQSKDIITKEATGRGTWDPNASDYQGDYGGSRNWGRREREDDERHDLDPTDWYKVKDGKMFRVSIYPRQVAQAEREGYSRTQAEAKAAAGQQGVAEGQLDEIFNPSSVMANFIRAASNFANDFIPAGLGALGTFAATTAVLGPVAGALAGSTVGNQLFQTLQNQQNKVPGMIQQLVQKYFGSEAEALEFAVLHAKAAFLEQPEFRWRGKQWPVSLKKNDAEAIIEKNDKYWLEQHMTKQNEPVAGTDTPMSEAMGGGVDSKGRTQSQWMKLVKAKYPTAKMQQAKMIDGPCQATLSDGRKLSWTKVQQGVMEVAPPGAKAERMVKHIKKGYAKDGKLTDKEREIAYATAWKAHKAGKVEEDCWDGYKQIGMKKKSGKTVPNCVPKK